jgi:hypothetical protein
MNHFWLLVLALTLAGLLLVGRRVMFRGRPVSHKRVFIIGFGNDEGNAGGFEDDWPSVIEAEAENSPLNVGSEITNGLKHARTFNACL